MQVADSIQIGLLIVNSLVGVVVAFYTWETCKLRKEAQRQNDHAVIPIVLLESASDRPLIEGRMNMPSATATIRNLGLGPAFDIEVESLEGPSTKIRFLPTPSLAAGGREPVMMDIREDGRQEHSLAYAHIQRMFHNQQLVTHTGTTIRYQDVHGKSYRTTLRFQYDALTKELATKFIKAEPLDSK